MAFDERLAQRLRTILKRKSGVTERKMFGGLAVMFRGNVCVGVWKDSLLVRVGPDDYQAALRESLVREFDITGRPMTGWVLVQPGAIADDVDLKAWVRRALKFTATLPEK